MGPAVNICDVCGKSFTFKSNLSRHQRTAHGSQTLQCQHCGVRFNRRDNLDRHVRDHHPSTSRSQQLITDPTGHYIQMTSSDSSTRQSENQVGAGVLDLPQQQNQNKQMVDESDKRGDGIENSPSNDLENDCLTSEEAIEGNLKKVSIMAKDKTKYDPMTFLKTKEDQIRSILKKELRKRRMLKFYITLQVRFTKTKGNQVEVAEPFFHGKCHILLKQEDMEEAIRESIMKIINSFVEYQREGSNWTLDKVLGVNVHIATYRPMKGASFLPLPAKLAKKKAIVNVQNYDDKCFMWSILAALHPLVKNHNRVVNYAQYADELDFTNISFPVRVCDVPKFEKKNEISINVFGYEQGVICPLHLTKERGVRHVNLLLISQGAKHHYCWIKNFDRLLNDGQMNQRFYCYYCLHGFTKKRLLQKHVDYCKVHGAQRTEMPSEEDKWLKFTDISKQHKAPFAVYADFECILEKLDTCQPNPQKSSTVKLAKHVPSGFTYKVVGITDELTEEHVTYRGPDVSKVFVEHMVAIEERLLNVLRNPKPMVMSDEDFEDFQNATHCSICGDELGVEVVRDHCHVTGNYRGAAHSACNLGFKQRERIPVFFHNLRGYDSHIIMEAIGNMKHKKINCIPQNHEKYISFSLGKLEFIDTFQFLSTSLEKLVANLSHEGIGKFKHLATYISNHHPDNFETKMKLLMRKGVYPYNYIDSCSKFEEQSLPPKKAFYNDIDQTEVSDADYVHAQKVWHTFGIQNMGQYHDLYM